MLADTNALALTIVSGVLAILAGAVGALLSHSLSRSSQERADRREDEKEAQALERAKSERWQPRLLEAAARFCIALDQHRTGVDKTVDAYAAFAELDFVGAPETIEAAANLLKLTFMHPINVVDEEVVDARLHIRALVEHRAAREAFLNAVRQEMGRPALPSTEVEATLTAIEEGLQALTEEWRQINFPDD